MHRATVPNQVPSDYAGLGSSDEVISCPTTSFSVTQRLLAKRQPPPRCRCRTSRHPRSLMKATAHGSKTKRRPRGGPFHPPTHPPSLPSHLWKWPTLHSSAKTCGKRRTTAAPGGEGRTPGCRTAGETGLPAQVPQVDHAVLPH